MVVLGALLSFAIAAPAFAVPLDSQPASNAAPCTKPTIRREWRSLSLDQRKDYLRAVNCMMSAPAKYTKNFSVLNNRYDDFVALHANSTGGGMKLDGFKGPQDLAAKPFSMATSMSHGIHGTGVFLPWHRYAIQVWEDALVSECGWTEGQPYWDWFLDNPDAGGSFIKSPLFDTVTGFGGNGKFVNRTMHLPDKLFGFDLSAIKKLLPWLEMPRFGGTGGGCIEDGPFANRILRIGPMGRMTPNNTRCITRSFSSTIANHSSSKLSLSKILSAKTFTEFQAWSETGSWSMGQKGFNVTRTGSLHDIGHGGVGGEMGDPFNSINDPIFWMHHTGMDRMWTLWQEQDPKRIYDAGARTSMVDWTPLRLNSTLEMGIFAPDRKMKDIFDTQNRDGTGFLCYKYEGLPIERYML